MCKGPAPGEVVVRKLADNVVQRVIEDNKDLKERLKDRDLPETRHLSVDVDNGKFSAPVVLHLPPNYNPRFPGLSFLCGRSTLAASGCGTAAVLTTLGKAVGGSTPAMY